LQMKKWKKMHIQKKKNFFTLKSPKLDNVINLDKKPVNVSLYPPII
jgi:hypothetical protein